MHVLQEWKQNIYFRRHELIEDIGSPYFQSLLVMGRGCWDMEMGCLAWSNFLCRLLGLIPRGAGLLSVGCSLGLNILIKFAKVFLVSSNH
jgi:hypothetical protein